MITSGLLNCFANSSSINKLN